MERGPETRRPRAGAVAARLLALFAVASVAIALGLRVAHRGRYYPGWDVVGAANGLQLISTRSLRELVVYYREHFFDGSLAWNVFGVPVALLPGALAAVWPWELWPHVLTPVLFAVALLVLGRALAIPVRESWILLLALGASPALLSHAVTGFPYVSSTLPFACALWIVLRPRGALVTAVLVVALMPLSFQVQELGRTTFVVFLAAAVLLPDAPRATRLVWLLAGGAQLALALRFPTANTGRYVGMGIPAVAELARGVIAVVRHFVAQRPDLPVLLVAGLGGALATGRRRWFWMALVSSQLALLAALAAGTGGLQGVVAVWPRRVLLFAFLCLAACAAAIRRGGALRPVLLALLVAGNLWQLSLTVRWARAPLDVEGWPSWCYALPYTYTPLDPVPPLGRARNLDSRVPLFVVDWYAEMRDELAAGHQILAVYNLTSFDENATDPTGVIDRLYLHLGHDAFLRRVHFFGHDRVRVNELPIKPMEALPRVLDGLDPATVRGYWLYDPKDDEDWPAAEKHRGEVRDTFAALESRFRLHWSEPSRDFNWRMLYRFTLEPK